MLKSSKTSADAFELYAEAANGSVESVRKLLLAGRDPNAASSEIGTVDGYPLLAAVFRNSREVVQLLVEHGADVNVIDGQQTTPFQAAVYMQDYRLALWLLSKGAKPFVGMLSDELLVEIEGLSEDEAEELREQSQQLIRVLVEYHRQGLSAERIDAVCRSTAVTSALLSGIALDMASLERLLSDPTTVASRKTL